jgi:hypothetical protein
MLNTSKASASVLTHMLWAPVSFVIRDQAAKLNACPTPQTGHWCATGMGLRTATDSCLSPMGTCTRTRVPSPAQFTWMTLGALMPRGKRHACSSGPRRFSTSVRWLQKAQEASVVLDAPKRLLTLVSPITVDPDAAHWPGARP